MHIQLVYGLLQMVINGVTFGEEGGNHCTGSQHCTVAQGVSRKTATYLKNKYVFNVR